MVHMKNSSNRQTSNDDVMLYTSDKKARLLCAIWSYKAIYS